MAVSKPLITKASSVFWVLTILLGYGDVRSSENIPVSSPNSRPSSISAQFDEKEFEPYNNKNKGTASIAGQAFLVTRSKEAKFEPGGSVLLIPVTSHTEGWFEEYVLRQGSCTALKGERSPEKEHGLCRKQMLEYARPRDKRLDSYLRSTRANPTGHFWFSRLPPGQYFITAPITWSTHGDND